MFKVNRKLYDICAVAITLDGVKTSQGWSCAFELPTKVSDRVEKHGDDLAQAMNCAKLVKDPKLGESIGAIGALS